MSQTGPGPDEHADDAAFFAIETHPEEHHHHFHRPKRPRGRGCLPMLVLLVVILGAAWFGGRYAYDEIKAQFAPPPDYAGPGSGAVLYQVKSGATSTRIGQELKKSRVVKSVDAFTDAAGKNDKSRDIQVGYYQLKRQMKASEALDVLVDPANQQQSLVVVPEGARVAHIAKTIAAKTDIPPRQIAAALKNPQAIRLPVEANGNPEGYLYPATYPVPPKQTAVGLLRQMVAKTVATEQDLEIEAKAKQLGLTPEQVLTVASILEYEANRSEDYPKVARVLYNRLQKGMPLQLDSTVSYISKRKGDVYTTAAERANPSLYNTYVHKGLPPGPIGSPGKETIEAALNPAKGNWLYFVPDYEAKTTRFSNTYAEHQKYVAKLAAYCRKSPDC